jgi:hypothetical protein
MSESVAHQAEMNSVVHVMRLTQHEADRWDDLDHRDGVADDVNVKRRRPWLCVSKFLVERVLGLSSPRPDLMAVGVRGRRARPSHRRITPVSVFECTSGPRIAGPRIERSAQLASQAISSQGCKVGLWAHHPTAPLAPSGCLSNGATRSPSSQRVHTTKSTVASSDVCQDHGSGAPNRNTAIVSLASRAPCRGSARSCGPPRVCRR